MATTDDTPSAAALEQAAAWLAQADGLVVAAGAGMGVDSGLPDFRGNQGFWQAYPALGAAGLQFSQVANPRSFQVDARLAWGFYGHRLDLYRRTRPHAGFELLRRWSQRLPLGARVFTSNVDGQFQRAGWPADQVHECHGSIHWLQCCRPCSAALWPADDLAVDVDTEACHWRGELPSCPRCGGLARPNILMFGDGQWQAERSEAQSARLQQWLQGLRRPVVVELGAGVHVATVRHFSHALRQRHGAALVRINPRESEVSGPRARGLALGALAGLQAIEAAWQAQRAAALG